MMRFLLTLLICFFLATSSFPFFHYFFKYYSPASGLPSLKVNKTVQDNEGYIWFGTSSGLCRYDGQNYRTFLVKDGLPSNMITTLLVDGNTLWVGTDLGLVKYNPSTQKIATAIKNKKIYAVYRDREGNLWVSQEGEVGILNSKELIKTYKNIDIPQKKTYAFFQDSKGNIWLGTDDGVYKMASNKKNKPVHYDRDKNFPARNVYSISEYDNHMLFGTETGLIGFEGGHITEYPGIHTDVTTILPSKDGTLWVGSKNGLSKITGTRVVSYSKDKGLPHNHVLHLMRDQENNLWISTNGGGVAKLSDEKFLQYDISFRKSNRVIYTILESPTGDLWFGGEGIVIHLPRDGNQWIINSIETVVRGKYIRKSFLDPKNNLWFLADDISKQSPEGKATPYARDFFLDGKDILSATPLDNEVWLGTSGGVYFINETTKRLVIPFAEDKLSQFAITDILVDESTWSESSTEAKDQDKPNAKTPSTKDTKATGKANDPTNTTSKVDAKAGTKPETKAKTKVEANLKAKTQINTKQSKKTQQTTPTIKKKSPQKVKSKPINPKKAVPVKSKSKKSISKGVQQKASNRPKKTLKTKKAKIKKTKVRKKVKPGQSEADKKGKAISLGQISKSQDDETRLPTLKAELWVATRNHGLFKIKKDRTFVPMNNKVFDKIGIRKLFQDSSFNLWVLTLKGLFKINHKSQKITQYSVKARNLLDDHVWDIHEDKNHNIWLGTNGGGLSKIAPDGKMTTYTEDQGLTSNFVYRIRSSSTGMIWIATNKALEKFDGKRFVSYNVNNGLNGNLLGEFTPLFIDSKDNVWVGTTNGVTQIVAEKDVKNTIPPKLLLDKVILNKSLYTFHDDHKLDYDENNLTFHFLGLSFKNENGIRYDYRLKGYENEWQGLTSQPYIKLSNLPAGEYTLQAKAQNQDGVWNKEVVEIKFTISPPFWAETWFIVLCIIAFIVLVYMIHKWQVKRLEGRNQILEDKVDERTRELREEKDISDRLLLNVLPGTVAAEIKETGSAIPKSFEAITIMFTDFKGFTQIAEKLSAYELVKELELCFAYFDDVIRYHNVEKLKTIGDAYMCAGGLPTVNATHPIDTILAAVEIQEFMVAMRARNIAENKPLWELRLGIHTGPVMAGVVGKSKFLYDIWGDSVNLASRMESSGEPTKINISGQTYGLVKDFFQCEHRGQIPAKNKGLIDMHFVESLQDIFKKDDRPFEPNDLFWKRYEALRQKSVLQKAG
ncbi:MAG: hypothetical protein IEMM0008_0079 [bacterium]|nr:MAG: hypothetical protein IEMM0008_0079 [bacterium]